MMEEDVLLRRFWCRSDYKLTADPSKRRGEPKTLLHACRHARAACSATSERGRGAAWFASHDDDDAGRAPTSPHCTAFHTSRT
jgi:hypothetical protein